MSALSVDTLHKLLICDPDAGKLWWRERGPEWFNPGNTTAEIRCNQWNARLAGREAFTYAGPSGHLRGAIFNKTVLAHRIIWAMATGAHPVDQIDHINGIPSDNRISNLREVTDAQNKANSGKRVRVSKSRFIGVRRVAGCKTFIATVGHEGRNVYVGSFRDEEVAARERDAVALRLKGEFARLNFPEVTNA